MKAIAFPKSASNDDACRRQAVSEGGYEMKAIKFVAVSLFSGFLVSACSSTQVTGSHMSNERFARPAHIVVYDMVATAREAALQPGLTAGYAGPSLEQSADDAALGRRLGAQVAAALVEEIQGMGLPAARSATQPPEPGDLVLKGYFQSVDKGSATKRVAIGFGKGAAELRTVVKGYEMTDHGLREVGSAEFESGGGKSPGMVMPLVVVAATANPVGLLVGGAVKAGQELSGSAAIEGTAKRTAEAIAKELRARFQRQGWI
jgi:hypothetical protein